MKTVKLTQMEIEMIKSALQYVYDRKIDIISQNRKILTNKAAAEMLEQANKYFDIQNVFDVEQDA